MKEECIPLPPHNIPAEIGMNVWATAVTDQVEEYTAGKIIKIKPDATGHGHIFVYWYELDTHSYVYREEISTELLANIL